jgi:hypothetical protein
MAEKKPEKCAHPGCECPVAEGSKYEVQDHVAVGTAVILQTSNFVVLGKACVRHCEPKGLRYTLGFYVPGRLPRTF